MDEHLTIEALRQRYHQTICAQIFGFKDGMLNIADRSSKLSRSLAEKILNFMGYPPCPNPPTGQKAGALFETVTLDFVQQAFTLLAPIRPGQWHFSVHGQLDQFDQYKHLTEITAALEHYPTLQAALGDYMITPDIVISRAPVTPETLNAPRTIYEQKVARLTPLLESNTTQPTLHASISCKWTIRSDRSQNARTEGLNLIRNRKGKTPHIAIVTAEPLPSRIASIALGTGDIDCVYHAALDELQQAVAALDNEALSDMLDLLVDGRRLRDISDLPFDLAI